MEEILCLPEDWNNLLQSEMQKPYFAALERFVDEEYGTHECYPARENIFRAFDLCPFQKVKVVLLGQDPYHEPGQAHGLSFSVPVGVKLPPSLRNIYKELASDLQTDVPTNGDLSRWATQGVLLLNSTLTVRCHQADSHARHGWETFTDAVISLISEKIDHVVFLLWGAYAIQKKELIDTSRHLVLQSPHPSPLSAHRGFFGNHHFSLTNQYLSAHNRGPINWI